MTDEKLNALREAWLDVPFRGVTDKGNGEWMQTLLNAVTDIVDPDGTLRETPEAQRRGNLAGYRTRIAYAKEQVRLAEANRMDPTEWIAKCDAEIDAMRAEFGEDA